MSLPACLLIETLLAPERAPVLTMAEWETLIGQARASQLLIRLATLLREQSLLQDIPPAPRRHLGGPRPAGSARGKKPSAQRPVGRP